MFSAKKILQILAITTMIANSFPDAQDDQIKNGLTIFSTLRYNCWSYKVESDTSGEFIIRDTVSNVLYYKNISFNEPTIIEKLDSRIATSLIGKINAINYDGLKFSQKLINAHLRKGERTGLGLSIHDGCDESLMIRNKRTSLIIQASNLNSQIQYTKDDDSDIGKINNVLEEFNSLVTIINRKNKSSKIQTK